MPVKIIEVYIDVRKSIEEQILVGHKLFVLVPKSISLFNLRKLCFFFKGFIEPSSEKLLPDLHPQEQHVFTLVLDLNETLVFSDWTVILRLI